MKFEFKSTDMDGTVITHEFEAAVWTDALDQFIKFLRGSGYVLRHDSIAVNADRHITRGDEIANWTVFRNEDYQDE